MSNTCSLCNVELTSMDTLLGENKLSDDNVLCNKCLEKASSINQELLYNLRNFSINDIKDLIQNGNTELAQTMMKTAHNPPTLKDIESHSIQKEVYKRRSRKIKYELEKLN